MCNDYVHVWQIVLYINYGRLAAYLWRRHRTVSVIGFQSNVHVVNAVQTRTPIARYSPNIIKMLVTVALLFLAAWAPYFTIITFKVRSV